MKKRARIIAISVTALFLSFSIPILTVFGENLDIYWSVAKRNLTSANLYTSKPSFSYVGSSYYNLDLTSNIDTSLINTYLKVAKVGVNSTESFARVYTNRFSLSGYNGFTSGYIGLDGNNYSNIILRFYDSSGAQVYIHEIQTYTVTGSYRDDYVTFIWNSSPLIVTNGNNENLTVQVATFTSFYSKNLLSLGAIYCEVEYIYDFSYVNYIEVIIPIFNIVGDNNTSDDTSEDTSEDISGDDTSNDLNEIENKLENITQSLVDSIGATNEVKDEVSRLGDEISQFHTDLTSLPPDFDTSAYEGVVSQIGDDVSNLTDWENSINDNINQYVSDVENFDTSALESYVEEGLNPLTNDTQDIAYESFLKNMYDSLGMGTYFVVFAPFAVIFVLFKFVIGGIT